MYPKRWLIGIFLVLAVALVIQSGLLAYAMYVLLGVLLVSRLLARTALDRVTATRVCKRTTAEVGDKAAVTVTVTNGGWLPVVSRPQCAAAL